MSNETNERTPINKIVWTWKRVVAVILIAVAGYFGIDLTVDAFDDTPDITPVIVVDHYEVELLQTQVALAIEEKAILAEDKAYVEDELEHRDAQVEQQRDQLATQAAMIDAFATTPEATPVPPTATFVPKPVFQTVKVTADKVVSHYYKHKNEKDFPIMMPVAAKKRIRWDKKDKIEVFLTLVKADGDRYFYELYDHKGWYVDADKVEVVE